MSPTNDCATTLPPDAPVFDSQIALKQCYGRRELLAQMIKFFFDDVDELLPQIRSALQRGDLVEVGRLGHRLKGTIAHLAAEPARAAALRVEQLAKHLVPGAEMEDAVSVLERKCKALAGSLGEWQQATQSHPVTGNDR